LVLNDDKGEIQIILLLPRPFPLRLSLSEMATAAPDFGEAHSPPLGRPATSEKKKDVLNVGVGGALSIPPRGVFSIDPKPPGEKRSFDVGECNHASTFEDSSKDPFGVGFP
jgi:hypothetical protein